MHFSCNLIFFQNRLLPSDVAEEWNRIRETGMCICPLQTFGVFPVFFSLLGVLSFLSIYLVSPVLLCDKWMYALKYTGNAQTCIDYATFFRSVTSECLHLSGIVLLSWKSYWVLDCSNREFFIWISLRPDVFHKKDKIKYPDQIIWHRTLDTQGFWRSAVTDAVHSVHVTDWTTNPCHNTVISVCSGY